MKLVRHPNVVRLHEVCMYADAVSSLSTIKFFCNLAEFFSQSDTSIQFQSSSRLNLFSAGPGQWCEDLHGHGIRDGWRVVR